ncbi:Flp family type IVb pilin [Aquamicrobium terrae]|uniref:Pilus assembly protein Flp/PilA n=1 Tax=Aquamicrobium terrae TaxID=1324945 RepID=A0ABV2N4N0_9HYPH
MARLIGQFLGNRQGTAAIEYGLIATLISIAIVVAVGGAADQVVALWDSNNSHIAEAFE